MALATGTRLGPYEIASLLGCGGMGEVYKARDTRLDRTVAVKILPDSLASDPHFRELLRRYGGKPCVTLEVTQSAQIDRFH